MILFLQIVPTISCCCDDFQVTSSANVASFFFMLTRTYKVFANCASILETSNILETDLIRVMQNISNVNIQIYCIYT